MSAVECRPTNTENVMSTNSTKPAEQFEEFAGKTIREAVSIARRHGYRNPLFTRLCGGLCVIRFARQGE